MNNATLFTAAMLVSGSVAAATSVLLSFTYTYAHEDPSRFVAESAVRAGYTSTCDEQGGEVVNVQFQTTSASGRYIVQARVTCRYESAK